MNNRTIIIAEAGVNHNGSISTAKKLIDAAVEANADFVKFQTFSAESLVTKNANKATYQSKNLGDQNISHYEMLKNLELSNQDFIALNEYSKSRGIKFLSTAFDIESLYFLKKLNLNIVKIPSGEITNLPYLRKAAELFKKVIISSGMSTMDDISKALNVFLESGISKKNITILHCNTEYPTPMKDVNLLAMKSIENEFGVEIGYSDHTLGIEIPIAAVTLGARIIEKHFTLDRNMAGPDHFASLEVNELKQMINSIRNIEQAISGDGIKKPSKSEIKNIEIARKSIVAKININKGEVFSEKNITTKRPGSGITPMLWDKVIGKIADRFYYADDLIKIAE